VSRDQRISEPPTTLSWARDIRSGGGGKATYTEVMKRAPMADGGKWVWQAVTQGCGAMTQG
jgi:hypothetical protein